jgi:hypothetical protein
MLVLELRYNYKRVVSRSSYRQLAERFSKMNPIYYYHVYFGSLSGKDYPFYGQKTFSIAVGSYGDPPDVHYAYEHYKLINYSGPITHEVRYAWIPEDLDEEEAVKKIIQIAFEADTRDRFGIRY